MDLQDILSTLEKFNAVKNMDILVLFKSLTSLVLIVQNDNHSADVDEVFNWLTLECDSYDFNNNGDIEYYIGNIVIIERSDSNEKVF